MLQVSLITISQYIRINFLKILSKCIIKQDYPSIMEWIIIDTSFTGYNKSNNDLSEIVEELRNNEKLPKIIYHRATKTTIGGWRNESANLVSGDIIVCMDDDDYYPPNRVSHAVEKLASKSVLIAGCDKLYFYDVHFNSVYSFKGFGNNHSTNNCLAYWKEYLINHSYDEVVLNGEEESFTKKYSEQMIQLESDKTILHFNHTTNTYDKKKIIIVNYSLPEEEQRYIIEQEFGLDYFIRDIEILDDYRKIFNDLVKPQKSPYDIIYCMGLSILWSPQQNNLGGSEQAVKYLSSEWVKNGKRVVVYSHIIKEEIYEGVTYLPFYKFNFWDEFDVLILWRMHGCKPYLNHDLKARKILLDLHDCDNFRFPLLINNMNKISNFMFKSQFHLEFSNFVLNKKITNGIVISNGIRISDFSKPIEEARNPFRLCYCSCYTRGLHRILSNIWPSIYKLEPRAELHVYYGMDLVTDKELIKEIKSLLLQPGVTDHGRQSVEIINKEKHMSTFHLYYTDSLAEIDCISIRESLVAGCIPIISNVNIFNERSGVQLQWFPNTANFNYQIACSIVELMDNLNMQKEFRDILIQSPTITSWEDCANEWLNHM